MDRDTSAELLALALSEPTVMTALQSATSAQEVVRIANSHGIKLVASDLTAGGELSDAELDTVSGGTILHPTMSVFCGTNGNFCTFNPYACAAPG